MLQQSCRLLQRTLYLTAHVTTSLCDVTSVDSCQDGAECTSVKRKIIPATKFDLDSTLSPSSSLPDLSDVEGQLTPDDASLSELHDGLFGPALDWEGSSVSISMLII